MDRRRMAEPVVTVRPKRTRQPAGAKLTENQHRQNSSSGGHRVAPFLPIFTPDYTAGLFQSPRSPAGGPGQRIVKDPVKVGKPVAPDISTEAVEGKIYAQSQGS